MVGAQGVMVADGREDVVRSGRSEMADGGVEILDEEVAQMDARAAEWFARQGAASAACRRELVVDARYVGQNFELRVPVASAEAGRAITLPNPEQLRDGFFAEHEQAYGYANRNAPAEVVNIRLTGLIRGLDLKEAGLSAGSAAPSPRSHRDVWFSGDAPVRTAIYAREDLTAGCALAGPAIVEQLDATIPIYPGDYAAVDCFGNILVGVAP